MHVSANLLLVGALIAVALAHQVEDSFNPAGKVDLDHVSFEPYQDTTLVKLRRSQKAVNVEDAFSPVSDVVLTDYAVEPVQDITGLKKRSHHRRLLEARHAKATLASHIHSFTATLQGKVEATKNLNRLAATADAATLQAKTASLLAGVQASFGAATATLQDFAAKHRQADHVAAATTAAATTAAAGQAVFAGADELNRCVRRLTRAELAAIFGSQQCFLAIKQCEANQVLFNAFVALAAKASADVLTAFAACKHGQELINAIRAIEGGGAAFFGACKAGLTVAAIEQLKGSQQLLAVWNADAQVQAFLAAIYAAGAQGLAFFNAIQSETKAYEILAGFASTTSVAQFVAGLKNIDDFGAFLSTVSEIPSSYSNTAVLNVVASGSTSVSVSGSAKGSGAASLSVGGGAKSSASASASSSGSASSSSSASGSASSASEIQSALNDLYHAGSSLTSATNSLLSSNKLHHENGSFAKIAKQLQGSTASWSTSLEGAVQIAAPQLSVTVHKTTDVFVGTDASYASSIQELRC